jgi:hypothetical protein
MDPAAGGRYPRVVASAGLAPPQYPDVEEDEEDVDGDEGDEDARSGRVRTIHRPHGRFTGMLHRARFRLIT